MYHLEQDLDWKMMEKVEKEEKVRGRIGEHQ